MAKSLEDYVMTYTELDETGNPYVVANIPDYYDRYIKPLDKKFENGSLHVSNTVICCSKRHNDTDPSLGLMPHKFYKGVKLYHCFGCGMTGTIIRLHQLIQRDYYDRQISERQSAEELCELFNIDASKFQEFEVGDPNAMFMRTERAIRMCADYYDTRDYKRDLMRVRMEMNRPVDDRIKMINSATVKILATKKKLYDL